MRYLFLTLVLLVTTTVYGTEPVQKTNDSLLNRVEKIEQKLDTLIRLLNSQQKQSPVTQQPTPRPYVVQGVSLDPIGLQTTRPHHPNPDPYFPHIQRLAPHSSDLKPDLNNQVWRAPPHPDDTEGVIYYPKPPQEWWDRLDAGADILSDEMAHWGDDRLRIQRQDANGNIWLEYGPKNDTQVRSQSQTQMSPPTQRGNSSCVGGSCSTQ